MTLRRITRDRRLSQDEASEYREVRKRVEKELPDLIDRHHEREGQKASPKKGPEEARKDESG
jgi:hypothetical protein